MVKAIKYAGAAVVARWETLAALWVFAFAAVAFASR